MISDHKQSIIISSMGWVDGGSLWCFHTKTNLESYLSLSNAKYLSIYSGKDDFFAVMHHFDSNQLEITAHHFDDPSKIVSKITILPDKQWIEGDILVWQKLPSTFVAYLSCGGSADFVLILVKAESNEIELQRFEWYNDTYDKGYQGIISATQIPNKDTLIVSIQRDSQPIIYDPIIKRMVGKIQLADRHGNPILYFRQHANELWVEDYDTLLLIQPTTWQIDKKIQLQADKQGCRRFVGEFAFDFNEDICAVARPFSHDVIGIETRDFTVQYRCETGGQPLEVALLPHRKILARDWKTGKLLTGTLQKNNSIP